MFFKNQKPMMARLALILALLGGIYGVGQVKPVYASTLIVINANEGGAGSLRQTIIDASPGDTINFDPSLAGQTIALTSQIDLDKDLIIDGSGLNPVVEISGSLATRIFYVSSNSTVTLQSLLLKNGKSNSASGGAIYNEGNLTVRNSTFIDNSATDNGGAIYSTFTIGISNSTFVNNNAYSGGAIYLAGGIFSNPTSNRTIVNSTFVSNHANTVGGQGGGIFNYGSGDLYGLENVLVLANNTFSGNGAHTGGGLYDWGSLSFNNNIFAHSTSGGDCVVDALGGTVTASNNLIADGIRCSPGSFINGDPLLGPLSDNGGSTLTMALLPGSPAIDAGTATCLPTDQRGVIRPHGAACEIGAYEYEYQTVIHHVKWDSSGANNGTSWADAYTDLQSALATALSGDEIWVAAGTYKPTMSTDRTVSFTLKNGVAIYGGFAGTETLLTQRNYETNVTILSGDIGMLSDTSDNSYHVVVGSNTNNYAKLNGFTVTGGNASNSPHPNDSGGGMYNDKGNPSLTNVIFTANAATFGGGMYNGGEPSYWMGSNPILTNVTFMYNLATEGGGLYNNNYSSPSLTNVSFSWNRAFRSGGGMLNYNYSNPIMTNTTFNNNSAGVGGGLMNWGSSSPILVNATFNANIASDMGGAFYNDTGSNPWLMHVTFSGNDAPQGGGMYNAYGSNPSVTGSILYGNSGGQIYDVSGTRTVTYSIVQDGYPGTGNLDADPLLGPLQNNDGFTQTMALGGGSPAIDAGDNLYCPSTDQRGVIRPQGSHCDVGAYEYVFPLTPTPTSIPTFTPTFTLTNTPTATQTSTPTPTNTFTPTATPPYSYQPLYLSFASSQTIGGVASDDEDILSFDGHNWMLVFDGSDVGLNSTDLVAFSFVDADTILMSFDDAVTVNGLAITPQDVVYFNATSLGSTTSGTFSILLDGSKMGLDTNAEKIDAVGLSPDRLILISTAGDPSVPGVEGKDEDVLVFTPILLDGYGEIISGTWAMYFDGSDVGLAENSNEDIDALDVIDNKIYLSTLGKFSINGLTGADEDIFVCEATSLGDVTACHYSSELYFDGSTWGLTANNVDAFNFLPPPYVATPPPAITLVP